MGLTNEQIQEREKLFSQGLKRCGKCKKVLPIIGNFSKDKTKTDELKSNCTKCNTAAHKRWAEENKDHCLNYRKNHYEQNKESILPKRKEYRKTEASKESHRKSCQKYRASGKSAKYERERKEVDINYKMLHVLRNRLLSALKLQGVPRDNRAADLVGCTLDELKIHIESQFTEGMTWKNYKRGGWSVDHIKPCAAFDLTKEEEQKICFHYTNLQPLWGTENSSKNSIFEGKKHYHKKKDE